MPHEAPTRIVYQEIEVKSRLHDFSLKKEDIGKICEAALYGRNLANPLHPKTAEGLLKYIYGVEGLRQVCTNLDDGEYEVFSKNNIEGVYDRKNGRKVMFQIVDQACGVAEPQPKSKIGNGKKEFIETSASVFLFPEMEDEEKKRIVELNSLNKAECWYVMVSIDTNGVLCCELSQPMAVTNGEFKGFHERIKVFKFGEFQPTDDYKRDNDTDDDTFEIKPTVLRK